MAKQRDQRTTDSPNDRSHSSLCTGMSCVLALLLLPGLAAGGGPPEVVKVRVPSESVVKWFAPGTELRGLSRAQLESLVVAAGEGFDRRANQAPPRLLQARHQARWDPPAGLLAGSSELVVEPSGAGPGELLLAPWTPAIEPGIGVPQVAARADGRTVVRVGGTATSTVVLHWQLRARPGSRGAGFTLGLPAADTARLVLDLPDGWIPEGPAGIRQGPDPTALPNRKTWQFDGPGGAIDLRVRDQAAEGSPRRDAQVWVAGPTRIDVLETSANWTMDWTVGAGPRGPRPFSLLLDAGLELIDVTGAGVDGFQAEALGAATRVTVRLEEDAAPNIVSVRAVARIPGEGAWVVPSARPVDAVWTGGTTSIRLDTSRSLEECRERAGRRVTPPAGELNDPRLLVFEAREPQPVAELVFRRPAVEASTEVRGRLLLGTSAPRLECEIAWRVQRGHLLGYEVDLPPAWVPDRVRIAGVDEPIDWHPEVLPGGGVRVHVVPPASAPERGPLNMTVEATATVAGGRGPLALPRVQPVGVRIADELWVAWTDPSLSLRPTSARGLAWIDPRLATAAAGPAGAAAAGTAEQGPDGLRGTLAWRWIAPGPRAEARVDREHVETGSSGTVDLRARVDRTRVRYDWLIVVQAGEDALESIVAGTSGPWAGPDDWHFEEETSGLELPGRSLDGGRRSALGLPGTGRAWEILLPHQRRGKVIVHAWLEQPWTGRGALPLLVLPERIHTRGTVVIEVDRNARSTVESTGLRALNPAVAAPRPAAGESPPPASPGYRRAHAFGYTSAGGRLELRTENLEPVPTTAVIREAVLTTTVNPQGASRQHLTLRIAADRTQALELTLPGTAKLTRVERDGMAITPTREGKRLSIPLIAPRAVRSYCTVTLDYLSDRKPGAGEGLLHPLLPAASLPCLGFCWEILAPEPWAVADNAPVLLATDPRSSRTGAGLWPLPWVRGWASAWRTLVRRIQPEPGEAAEAGPLRSLDALVVATRPDEVTLGEWFTRWDAGTAPLVVDRVALASAGWGPKSRVVPPQFKSPRTGAARDTLRPLGMTVVPVGGTLLITTRREAPDLTDGAPGGSRTPGEWEAAMIDAVAWGYDRTERFQSVARWRGEATPKVSIRGETTESEPLLEGWRYWRLVAPGWPGPGAAVHLINEQRRAAWGWTVGLAIVLAGVAAGRASARRRATVLAILLAATSLIVALCPARLSLVAWGALAGELGVAMLWLGASVPGWSRGRAGELRSSPSWRRLTPGATASMLLTLVATGLMLGAVSRLAIAERGDESPIVALFPYDGPPDPDRVPDRVILRREDAERLQALAAATAGPSSHPPLALSATHRVRRQGERDIVVESEYRLARESGQASAWTFPVEDAREITATVDDRRVPVQVAPDGRVATVALDGPGSERDPGHCVLQIRRVGGLRHRGSDDALGLAINPVATARVVVEEILPDRPHIEVPSARGRIAPRDAAVGVEGLLGPAHRLEVRWSARAEPGLGETAGAVEGLLLWDAQPAGDHVEARLTYRGAGGVSTIRLGLDPGMVLRTGSLSGLVDASWQGTDEHPEWVASVDPPLADGATIQLEFWRPAPAAPADERTLPRIEPLGVERYTGALGFRRPAGWTGRLSAGAGFDPMTDEAFVKAWGNLSEEPLTFAGTVRFLRRPAVSIATGPPPDQLLIDPEVQVTIEAGRLSVNLGADLVTVSGRSYQVALALPPDLELVTVEADGLGDWSRPTRARLLLRFDGPALNRREVRIQAWLPVPTEPLATGVANPEVDIPWPRWSEGEVRAGQLTIVSPTRFQLVQATGTTVLGAPTGTSTSPSTGSRAVYRVDRPEGPGRLTWEVEPPRLEVLVQSQLTVLPDYAEWVAVLRYDVSGGGADAVHLRLPSLWAAAARVQVVGDGHQLATETRGTNTFWMIRPDHSIWGSQRLIVRSAIPLPKTGTLSFPELSPLGRWGRVDSYLALVNASGRELVTEGSPGLQPIADDTRFRADEFAATPGVSPSVYHVRRDGWSLKVHGPDEPRATGRPPDEARVLLAELACTLRDDGSVVGLAVYEVEPRSGPFLALDPPEHCEPLWATVNHIPTPPLLAAAGRWLIPIPQGEELAGGGQVPVQVRLIWNSVPDSPRGERAHPLPVPALDQPNTPIFVTTHAPAAVEVKSPNGSLELVPRERLEVARLEWQGRRIADALGKLDRSSQRECEALVSSLVQFELLKREAQRSARWNQTSPLPYRDLRIARLDERVAIASRALADALRNGAFDEFAESARIHVGLVADDPTSSTLEIPEPNTSVRIRRLGRPRYFQGESALKDRAPALTWTMAAPRTFFDRPLDWALVLLGFIAIALTVAFGVTILGATSWIGPATLVLALVGLAVAAGPLALAWGLGMAWLGWVGR